MLRKTCTVFVFAAAMLLLAAGAAGQTTLTGRVVSVIDGRTCVIETDGGRVTAAIQYVDVPEPEQPFSRIVREHLERLVMGKQVTFASSGYSPTALVGRLYLNGLDMGQQLIRDGAAWHVPIGRSGQNFDEARAYVGLEILAKAERRGIWSIPNLTPAWEFRALKDKSFQDVGFMQAANHGAPAEDRRNYKFTKASPDMWAEVGGEPFAQRNPNGQLFWGYDVEKMIRNLSTQSVAQVLLNGRRPLEVEVRAIYFQGEIKPKTRNIAYVLGILAISREHSLAKENAVSFNADGTTIEVGGGQRFWREHPLHVQEMLQYRISRSDLAKIAAARKVTVSVGAFSGTVSSDLQRAIRELVETAGP